MPTLESAKCIKANLNAIERAILDGSERDQLGALSILKANLFAAYYDALPVINGQKNWPPIKDGDTWESGGEMYPYAPDSLDLNNGDF